MRSSPKVGYFKLRSMHYAYTVNLKTLHKYTLITLKNHFSSHLTLIHLGCINICRSELDHRSCPEEDQADAGGGGVHIVLLVLVQPLVTILHQQLVLTKPSVDESIDDGARQEFRAGQWAGCCNLGYSQQEEN